MTNPLANAADHHKADYLLTKVCEIMGWQRDMVHMNIEANLHGKPVRLRAILYEEKESSDESCTESGEGIHDEL